jgi:uracil-DNA glycosylase
VFIEILQIGAYVMQREIVRGVVQRLESLERAGVTHVKKIPKRVSAPLATGSDKGDSPMFADTKTGTVPNMAQPPLVGQKAGAADGGGTGREVALAAVAREVAACTRCAELAATRTQTVFGVGNPNARLVFCGEAPGADEDRDGEPFVGRAGQLLTDIIVKGMKMRRADVYILNILRCRPPGNRNPLPVEAANCREYLDCQLAIIQPEFICCLGAVAAQNLLGTDISIGKLRGRIHDLHGIKVVCTYHPAYVLRNPAAKKSVWEDIQMLMAEMGKQGRS